MFFSEKDPHLNAVEENLSAEHNPEVFLFVANHIWLTHFSRPQWSENYYLTFSHIKDLMLNDLELGLQLCLKITTIQINLIQFSNEYLPWCASYMCICQCLPLKSMDSQK